MTCSRRLAASTLVLAGWSAAALAADAGAGEKVLIAYWASVQ